MQSREVTSRVVESLKIASFNYYIKIIHNLFKEECDPYLVFIHLLNKYIKLAEINWRDSINERVYSHRKTAESMLAVLTKEKNSSFVSFRLALLIFQRAQVKPDDQLFILTRIFLMVHEEYQFFLPDQLGATLKPFDIWRRRLHDSFSSLFLNIGKLVKEGRANVELIEYASRSLARCACYLPRDSITAMLTVFWDIAKPNLVHGHYGLTYDFLSRVTDYLPKALHEEVCDSITQALLDDRPVRLVGEIHNKPLVIARLFSSNKLDQFLLKMISPNSGYNIASALNFLQQLKDIPNNVKVEMVQFVRKQIMKDDTYVKIIAISLLFEWHELTPEEINKYKIELNALLTYPYHSSQLLVLQVLCDLGVNVDEKIRRDIIEKTIRGSNLLPNLYQIRALVEMKRHIPESIFAEKIKILLDQLRGDELNPRPAIKICRTLNKLCELIPASLSVDAMNVMLSRLSDECGSEACLVLLGIKSKLPLDARRNVAKRLYHDFYKLIGPDKNYFEAMVGFADCFTEIQMRNIYRQAFILMKKDEVGMEWMPACCQLLHLCFARMSDHQKRFIMTEFLVNVETSPLLSAKMNYIYVSFFETFQAMMDAEILQFGGDFYTRHFAGEMNTQVMQFYLGNR